MRNPQYELNQKSNTEGKNIYHFRSADGVPSKKSFRDAELAIADHVETEKDDNILVAEAGYGFLGVIFGDKAPEGHTVVGNTSDRAQKLSKINIKQNNTENASCKKFSFYKNSDKKFDKLLYAPHGYKPVDLVKKHISNLIDCLKTEGELYIAGKKTDGINRYKNYLDSIPGELEKISQDRKQRVYKYRKNEDFEPESIEIEKNFKAEVKGKELSFKSCEGLFSADKLDKGTRLLLENLEASESDKVLDLACGYGIIGIFIKKLYGPEIYFSDDSKWATYYTEKNLELNNIEEYELENKDCLDGFKNEKFDLIVSNPPTHQGKGVTEEMFEESYKNLRKDGELYLVYNQNMGYEKQLQKIFKKTDKIAEEGNFLVIRAIR